MRFDCRSNYFAAEAICFFVQWMHRRESFTEGGEGNKDWSWICNPSLSSFPSVYVFSL
jgi:hypothetical protein